MRCPRQGDALSCDFLSLCLEKNIVIVHSKKIFSFPFGWNRFQDMRFWKTFFFSENWKMKGILKMLKSFDISFLQSIEN